MSKDTLIDDHVSLGQIEKAVGALHSHQSKQTEEFEKNQILPAKEQHIWVNVAVKKMAAEHKLKPVKIPIVHPLVDPRVSSVCLITKDPQRQYKDLLEASNIKFVSRVVGIEKLKGKFKAFEARRALLKENELFLADDRVIPLLPKLLGAKWFEAKKQPIPVSLTKKNLKVELEGAISSTYMNQNRGTCTSIKVGKMSQNPSQIVDNIKTALPSIVKAIKGGWDNIQSLAIKTNSSVSLPIWSCRLDAEEGGRWAGLEAGPEEDEDEVVSDEDKEPATSKKSVSKSRKRPSSSDEEHEGEEEKPKKKAKGADGAVKAKKEKVATSVTAVPPTPTKKQKAAEEPSGSTKSLKPVSSTAHAGKKAKPVPETQTSSETAEKAGKKSKALATLPAAVDSTTIPSKSKKSKPSDAAPTSDTASSTKPKATKAKDTPSVSAHPVPTVTTKEAEKTAKKKEKVKTKETEKEGTELSEPPKPKAAPTVSKSEKKRAVGGALEKKKGIIAQAKGGKSAKNTLLGKKVAQE